MFILYKLIEEGTIFMKKSFYPAKLIAFCLACGNLFAQTTSAYTVTNRTGMVITSAGGNAWSTNLSTKTRVLNNDTFEFTHMTDKTNCSYDVKYMSEDGKSITLKILTFARE